ncbi:iron/ascorbate oxidoreductase [Acrasis kona]|uniref:Iron/ascorbate oxidoreductase n=1 Tax=Acrasis kona TaxID=1008807 RepID=A0AAW2ZJX1_9EUKA
MSKQFSATVDITALLDPNSTVAQQNHVGEQIGEYCKEFGFFYVESDLIPWSKVVDKAFESATIFFEQSTQEQKDTLSMRLHGQHRGYFNIGDENVDDTSEVSVIDIKEGFDIGLDPSKYTTKNEFSEAKNNWPEWLSSEIWRTNMEAYFDLIISVGRAILKGFSISLGFASDYLDSLFTEPLALLRILKYSPLSNYPKDGVDKIHLGAGEHTDYGCITILLQDLSSSGLQIKHKDEWINVPPMKNKLVVNVGDAMEMWTNGLYKATTHRVVLTQSNSSNPRYSIPVFFEPNYEVPMKSMIGGESKYNSQLTNMCFGEYLAARLTSTFTYRK